MDATFWEALGQLSLGHQPGTLKRIAVAWILTLPAAITLSATLFITGCFLIPGITK